jgi:hypothetical protein
MIYVIIGITVLALVGEFIRNFYTDRPADYKRVKRPNDYEALLTLDRFNDTRGFNTNQKMKPGDTDT